MGNLSIRCWAGKNAGAEVASAPALIGFDEFQLAIPWRDALQQSPPPLHQPGAVCCTLGSPVEHFAANGDLSLNCLSHPRGQAQNKPIPSVPKLEPGGVSVRVKVPDMETPFFVVFTSPKGIWQTDDYS